MIYARIENGVVTNIIEADLGTLATGLFGPLSQWVSASEGPEHPPIRKKHAAIGDTYSADLDAFIRPWPGAGWTLNLTSCDWESSAIESAASTAEDV